MNSLLIILIVVLVFGIAGGLLQRDKKNEVIVKTVKGDKAAAREIERMRSRGYTLDQQSSRKMVYSATAGIFTRKQKHTLTFTKTPTIRGAD